MNPEMNTLETIKAVCRFLNKIPQHKLRNHLKRQLTDLHLIWTTFAKDFATNFHWELKPDDLKAIQAIIFETEIEAHNITRNVTQQASQAPFTMVGRADAPSEIPRSAFRVPTLAGRQRARDARR